MNKIEFSAIPNYDILNNMSDQIHRVLGGSPKNIIESCESASWELLENAIKYGSAQNNQKEVKYEFTSTESEIIIKISNGFDRKESLMEYLKIMDKIHSTEDKSSLYINRLSEILENPKSTKSQLGLYKIAAETDFVLNYHIEDQVLITTAVLSLDNKGD
ncbi:MAG: hypothetical protein H7A24_16630 [Leptospiraceae bacterium]|nr:hypothetical protein [Leptospiraceae bacterium]MCP5513516.1 hypothetical protein [Leptospiraceae bacterium]